MTDYIDKVSLGGTTYDVKDSAAHAALDNKADIDGTYEQMTVGNADQLVATVGVEDKTPYNFRTAGGSADIGDRLVEKVVGGTVAWNQAIKFGDGDTWNKAPSNATLTKDVSTKTVSLVMEDGSYRMKYTVETKKGHVYFACADITATANCAVTIEYSRGWTRTIESVQANTKKLVTSIMKLDGDTDQYSMIQYYIYSDPVVTYPQTITVRNPQIYDLTQMFGSTIADYIYSLETANAGAGVAWFKKLFPKPYYAYNTGELMSVQAASHITRGFNAWDEEWVNDNHDISTTTGELVDSGSAYYFRSKNFIPILPSTVYYDGNQVVNGNYRLFYYDAEKNYISYISHPVRTTFTTPANAYYMKFRFTSNNGYTYQNNICINLSWDGERDGEYEPYTLHEYPLDSTLTLRGIPKLDANNELYYDGDEYESDGTVTRKYIQYTITGNEAVYAWGNTGYGTHYGGALVLPSEYQNIIAFSNDMKGMATKGYQVKYANEDRTIYASTSTRFSIIDDRYTTQETWLAGITGTTILFLISTPTTESADTYQNPQVVDDFGTEEYVDAGVTATTPTRDVAIPVGHVSQYQANLRAKLEMAPNSPDGDGDYIVRQTNGQNEYVTITFPADELPAAPTSNGTYTLKCTVSGSGTTYSWVSDA